MAVEVKSGSCLQSWPTRRHSWISFGNLSGRSWDERTGQFADAPTYRADVYVFAVQTAREHWAFDPLDVSQPAFWVAPGAAVEELGHRSLSLSTVESLAEGPMGFDDLAAGVERAAGRAAERG